MSEKTAPIFGRVATAMITPFNKEDQVDLSEAAKLATYLVKEQSNDTLVINGTTGECPTTSDEEKQVLLEAIVQAVGNSAQIVAGVGTFDTKHTIELARQAEKVGVDGLLVVAPYYSRPSQDDLVKHFLTVADATELPIILYDIPHRTGTPIETETLIKLADHPNIVAVKDAKGSPVASSKVIAETNLAYYSGDDAITLSLLAVGGVGVIGTSTHFVGDKTAEMIDAFTAGRLKEAISRYQELLPIFTGVFAVQGCVMVKGALNNRGFEVGSVRSPLYDADPAVINQFCELLDRL